MNLCVLIGAVEFHSKVWRSFEGAADLMIIVWYARNGHVFIQVPVGTVNETDFKISPHSKRVFVQRSNCLSTSSFFAADASKRIAQ